MHFPRALARSESHKAAPRIRILVIDSISYNNQPYAKHASPYAVRISAKISWLSVAGTHWLIKTFRFRLNSRYFLIIWDKCWMPRWLFWIKLTFHSLFIFMLVNSASVAILFPHTFILKKTNVSFIVHFCFGKYTFCFDIFLFHLVQYIIQCCHSLTIPNSQHYQFEMVTN